MKRSLYILASVLLFASCDKIEPDQYTIYAGPTLVWEQGSTGAGYEPVQRAYVEKYTGPKCPNCPAADVTLDAAHQQYGSSLVVVSINHPKGQGEPFPGEPDMRTDDGTAWDNYFGINAIPTAYINRRTATQYSGAMDNIKSDIGAVIAENPVVGVTVDANDEERDGTVDITVNLVFAQSYNKPLTLTLALIEDALAYRQINGTEYIDDYVHNHMLRDVITDLWGADIDCTGATGEARRTTVSYTLPEGVVEDNCHIVAFVSDKASREVLNCDATVIHPALP